MRRVGYQVIDLLVDYFAGLQDAPVGAKATPEHLTALLFEILPDRPSDPAELLARLSRDVFPNVLHVDHPRFFAFVPGPNNFMSAMGDALASGFNVFNGTWLGGSAAAALELQVIDWLCRLCGLPGSGGGLFVSGGSVANMTALVAARHALLDDDTRDAIVYFSDQTHSSVERALRVIGFSPAQFRKLPTDSAFCLEPAVLEAAIAADRSAGLRPFCVVANAGTTNTGAVDPLESIAALCRRERLWLHADGAYGAAAVLSESGRAELKGLDQVDSLSLDPHKWLFQSFECGCVLVRDKSLLKAAFRIMPEYLQDVHRGAAETHPCDYGIQLSRGFRALKVWLSLKTFGLDAFRAAVERGFELAAFAQSEVESREGWEILSPARMGIVCFRFGNDDTLPMKIVDAMLAEGYAFLTSTRLRGVSALRLCTINPRTTRQDIVETVNRLDRHARAITGARS